jgi:hypothetical protein
MEETRTAVQRVGREALGDYSVFVGIPSRGVVFAETLRAIPDPDVITTTQPVEAARNEIIQAFLWSTDTHLWMIDDDEVPPLGIIWKMLEANQPVVVVDAPAKKSGKSNVFRNSDGTVAATGFGCALFQRKVFETIPAPWFTRDKRRHVVKMGGFYSFPEQEGAANPWGGEDIEFSMKLWYNAINIHVLDGVTCTHLEYEPFNQPDRATRILDIKRYTEITGPPL